MCCPAMPRTQDERQAGHQRPLDDETAASWAAGAAQRPARVELPSHHEAVTLTGQLCPDRPGGRPAKEFHARLGR
jgi:hypothetical protein